MTRIEMAIADRVAGLAPVVAIAGARVYLDRLPQSPTYPCVRVELVDDLAHDAPAGPGGPGHRAHPGRRLRRSQVSGADPYQVASDLADAIEGDGLGDGASGCRVSRHDRRQSRAARCWGFPDRSAGAEYDPDELRVITISQDYRVEYRRT